MSSFLGDGISIKQNFFLFLISMLAATWLAYSCVLLPQWGEIDKLSAQYILERQHIKVIEDFLLVHPNPEQYILELDKKLLNVSTMLPDNPEISSLLKYIEELSHKCDVHLSYVKPIKVINKEGYQEYELELLLQGNFMQSMLFLNQFENNSRFTNVITIVMMARKNDLETTLSARVYSYDTHLAVISHKSTDNKN